MRALFSEIRRRRVLRTVTIYLAGAWLLVEVSSTIFPILELPDWWTRVVIGMLAAGLPVVIVLSWIFDVDLGTIRRTDALPDSGQATAAGKPAPVNSVAVLPFVNVSNDPDNAYFGDGISEELIDRLVRYRHLHVPARTSSFAFRNSDTDVRTVAARLGVRHVLEGSVRRVGTRVRIAARLVEAQDGYQLWAETFDRQIEDIFEVQSEISSAIAGALEVTLGAAQSDRPGADGPPDRDAPAPDPSFAGVQEPAPGSPAVPPTRNIDAYEHYLRGRYLWQKRGAMAIRGAINVLERAVDLDPGFAEAQAALACARATLHEYSGESRDRDFDKAREHARYAIQLKPGLAEARAALGYMSMRNWNWDDADRQLSLAVSQDDTDPLFHQWYSNFLNDVARLDDGLAEAQRAFSRDPVSPMANTILAFNYMLHDDAEGALKHAGVAREFGVGGLVPDYVDYITHLRAGRYDEAIETCTKSLRRAGKNAGWVEPAVTAMADPARLGRAMDALAEADGKDWLTDNALFVQYILLAQPEAVFALARRKLADRSLNHTWLMLPEAAPLRETAEFVDLAKRMGLVDYWEAHGWPDAVPAVHLGVKRHSVP